MTISPTQPPAGDEYNQPQVNISLDSAGGNIMSNFTKDNIGKPMATLFVEYKDSGKKMLTVVRCW